MAFILIIDDDDIISEAASQVLINAGHACGWVSDAEEAMNLLRWRRPDLLLLDQNMPGMSGGKFLRHLRSSPKFYDLPVIMFTGMKGAEDEQQALYNGAQDYIRKPFDPKFLLWRVNQVLESSTARSGHRDLKEFLAEQQRMNEDYAPHRSSA
ncbi:response regulator [Paraurantiacibacter namhicola]|uniref:Phosphate regulon transcriptional regulatory protein PhoB n=1 Tax=Paraurantiacibacter namhicola TaxID=645517 RepID=A0A1C7DA95_9SPHN|nr:response regulator [Paraurantiacibacter namhicola]ANU08223.1 Phosphate regulon transcriptional regulatory protein PhoB [Paraurantiacibacter namhicola]